MHKLFDNGDFIVEKDNFFTKFIIMGKLVGQLHKSPVGIHYFQNGSIENISWDLETKDLIITLHSRSICIGGLHKEPFELMDALMIRNV